MGFSDGDRNHNDNNNNNNNNLIIVEDSREINQCPSTAYVHHFHVQKLIERIKYSTAANNGEKRES